MKTLSVAFNVQKDHVKTFLSKNVLQKTDVVVEKLYESTEEGKKVTRNSGEKFLAVFRRIEDPYVERCGQVECDVHQAELQSMETEDGCE